MENTPAAQRNIARKVHFFDGHEYSLKFWSRLILGLSVGNTIDTSPPGSTTGSIPIFIVTVQQNLESVISTTKEMPIRLVVSWVEFKKKSNFP